MASFSTMALIVAAGESQRFEGGFPKQYQPLAGLPVLRRAILALLSHRVDAVQVVIHPAHAKLYEKAVAGLTLLPAVHGGATRQQSVLNGLLALHAHAPTYVLIHDAARPLVDAALIGRVTDSLKQGHKAVFPAVTPADTLREKTGEKTLVHDRDRFLLAQTPQGFDYATILQLHREANGEATDDASLCERAGIILHRVEGSARNFKITTREDFAMAEQLLAGSMETRVGMGVDVHRMSRHTGGLRAAERFMTLCGIKIPSNHMLEGHSDADAGVHAAVDAVLGAIGEGDIGQHFPPSDSQWRGVESKRFLQHAMGLLRKKGGWLVHLDITIIAEEPKISPFRDAMRQAIADMCEIDSSRVSVKATTTETLGFTGRKEGLAAQAAATVSLPL